MKEAGKGMKGEVMTPKVGDAVTSDSPLQPGGGKGYSKRGETSNGVPTIEEGECSDKLARLSRGFKVMVLPSEMLAASESG